MKRLFIISLVILSLSIYSCTNKSKEQEDAVSTTSDSINQVPDENVRPTGDLRSTENVDLDTTGRSSDKK